MTSKVTYIIKVQEKSEGYVADKPSLFSPTCTCVQGLDPLAPCVLGCTRLKPPSPLYCARTMYTAPNLVTTNLGYNNNLTLVYSYRS